ncbi:beta strand repeat-containing protein [Limnoglobus roseus]|uniref:Big-1 domain-containing protein n=1 Tax=Limnoglobus roseus TaxID=2598579 RepID=A0A5C1APE5_9BACT|nr:VCBS repeat-containing protein [Limnoglobus roseus]QEL20027.1 hypothetical protein PX52LOC_07113 [Limnoglobus roseus]
MPARRVASSRRDLKAETRTNKATVGLRGTLEQLDDRLAPAVFTATIDPGTFGANNAPAIAELLGFFATAATNNEPDTINLIPFATYTFSAAADMVDGGNAVPTFVADGGGRNGITINGNGATITRAGGGPNFRFFDLGGTPATTYLTINDLTLTGGSTPAAQNGGAILSSGGSQLIINNSNILNNTAVLNGGGVYLTNGSGAVFNNVTLSGNTAQADGGAVASASTGFVQFNNSRINNNTATTGTGGAVGTAGSFEFNDSTLDSNTGKTGGAFSGTDAVFNRDTITNNKATTTGTGGVSSGNASIRVVGSYVAGNQGQTATSTGGGVQGANVTVINSTIDSNSSAGVGVNTTGGVGGTNVTIQSSTISRNSTTSTGSGGVRAGSLSLTGSIVANNTTFGTTTLREVQVTGAKSSTSGGFNLITVVDGGAKFNLSTGDIASTDPDPTKAVVVTLGTPQANGGPVFTRALPSGSQAINAGPFTPTVATDGRGFSRVVNNRSDIGAFEVQTGNSVGLISGDDQTAQTNQSFATNLQVLVTDPNGTPVPNVIARFQAPTTPNPTASAVFFSQGSVTGVLTNFSGMATVPLAANGVAGDYVVTAGTGSTANGATFNLRNTAFGIRTPASGSFIQIFSGDNQTTTANAQFGNNLVVQILDSQGNGLNNVPVTLTAPTVPNQPSLTFPGGGSTITVNTSTLTIVNPSTGVSSQIAGLISVPVNANTVASATPYLVEASGPNVGTANFNLTNAPAVASKVSIVSGAGQATLTNTAFSSPLSALVTDTFGNPVLANVSVRFAGPASGPGVIFSSQTFTTVVTNANGIAQAQPTANATGGSYFVDATVTGGTQMASFNLSNIFVPPPPPPPPPPANSAPIITDVLNQTIVTGQSGTYAFGAADAETSSNNLVLSANSNNPTLISSLTFGGSGINRTITVNTADGQTGTATITLLVTDEQGATATDTFDVTVTDPTTPPPPPSTPSNTPPVISNIADQTIIAGQSATTPFIVLDGETAAAGLVVTASAANPTLISSVSVTGTGSNRSVSVSAAAGQTGSTTVTVTVTDGDNNQTSDSFVVTVPLTTSPPPPPVATPTVPLVGSPQFAVGSGTGGPQVVRYFNADGSQRFIAPAFPGLTGGVRTATGDFNGDGVADVVIGTGPGSATQVQILNGTDGSVLFVTQPFEAAFTGGVYVAAGDLNGDGVADLVITPDEGGGPRARILSGNGFGVIADFFVIDDPAFRGGARAALGDVNGDGRTDLIASAGPGGGPRIAGYDGTSLGTGSPRKLFNDFFLFEPALRNGAFITVGDINADGFADIIGGGGPGGAPRVLAINGQSLLTNAFVPLANFFAGDTNDRSGVRVAVKNLNNDTSADLVVGSGDGSGSKVTGYLMGGNGPTTFSFDAFPGQLGGVYVG